MKFKKTLMTAGALLATLFTVSTAAADSNVQKVIDECSTPSFEIITYLSLSYIFSSLKFRSSCNGMTGLGES